MLRRAATQKAEVAFFNAPSMKSSAIDKEITTYDIKYRMLPYDDDVVTITLTEKQFIDLLNREAKTIITKDLSQVLHCAGIKYTINKTDAKNNKICVSNVRFLDKDKNVTRTIDVQNPSETKTVKCAITKFLLQDSSLTDILKDVLPEQKVGNQQEIFIEQIKLNGEFRAEKDGRLTIIE